MDDMSRWARLHSEDEDFELDFEPGIEPDFEPGIEPAPVRSITPPTPVRTPPAPARSVTPPTSQRWFVEAQAALAREIELRKKRAGVYALRSVVLFAVWMWLPKPWWAGFICFWAMIYCASSALWNLEQAHLSRLQRRVPPV
jgi:hypothetical protein